MTKSREKFFSVEEEVALHPELLHASSPAEVPPETAKSADGDYYQSVAFEPGVTAGQGSPLRLPGQEWPWTLAVLLTIFCGLVGGLLAVPALFLKGKESGFWVLMLVVFGPFAEETLKQCGMIFQMEKLPGTIRRDWQFFLAALLGAAVFSVLENLLYRHVYLRKLPPEQLAVLMNYRWFACTALHICCTMISALGLRRVWRDTLRKGVPCQISDAFPWFVVATALHGAYNLLMLLLQAFGKW